jgi:hypothetical protein
VRNRFLALASVAFLLPAIATPALSQWQVPNFSTPQGRGTGKTGFDSFGPCLAGVPFIGAGVAAKGACGSESIALLMSAGVGVVAKTAAATYAVRTLTGPAEGLTITNPAGTAGNPTFAFANDLLAIEALTGTGIPARTATDTWALRTLTAPAAGLTITNPAGVAGNPTFVLANDLAALEALSSTGYAKRTGTDTWTQLSASGILDDISTSNGAILCRSGGTWSVIAAAASGVLTAGGTTVCPTYSAVGSGSVTKFTAGNLSPLFTTSVGTPTTTPALTFAQTTQTANLVFAGPSSGGAANPTFRALVAADYGGAWTAYTPTMSCSSGTITSHTTTARYAQYGKTVAFQVDTTLTNAGTCAGFVAATLPVGAQSSIGVASRDFNSGFGGNAWISGGTGTVQVQKYDGTAIVSTSTHWVLGGVYEAQ